MTSGTPRSCLLDKSQRSMNEACNSEAQKGIAPFKSTHGVLCDACSPRLEKLRVTLKFLREENRRLISQLHSVVRCNNFTESAGVSPDEALALAGFHSLSSSSDHIATSAMHSLLPEYLNNLDDFHLAVVSSTLKEQIASTEKEWKILAGRYNELVEQIQHSEKLLADVRNRNFQLESINAELLSTMLYKQRRSQVFLNQVMDDQVASTRSVAQVPADCMDEKSPEIWKGSMYTSPMCTFELKMDIACRANNPGPSPVSVLVQNFDNECLEDSTGVASKSPAYALKGRTCGEDTSMFCRAGDEDEYLRSDLLHAQMAVQEIDPPNDAAPIKCIFAILPEGNSAGIVSKRQLTSVFDASLHLSEKEGCNQ